MSPENLFTTSRITDFIDIPEEKLKSTVFNTFIRSIRTDKESMMVGLKFTKSIFPETDAESSKDLEAYVQTLQNGR